MFESAFDKRTGVEALSGFLKEALDAEHVEFVKKSNFEHQYSMHISWVLTADMSMMLKSDSSINETFTFIQSFLEEFSKRISYGEIKELRERCKNYEETLKDKDEKIKELERYKTAYELN